MSDPKYANLIDLPALSRFKTNADVLYATNADLSTLSDRVDDIIEEGGEPNVIETVKVNGSALTPDANKAVDVTVPTALSDLTNDNNTVTDASYVHTDNNYTSTEKTKLSGIAEGAQVNVLEGVQVNGTDLTVSSKKVNVTVAEGSTDGTVAVNGTDVSVHGLGSAAYTASTAYDAAGAADDAKSDVIGESTDVYGTDLTLNALKNEIDSIEGSGSGSIADQIADAIGALDYSVSATSGQAITGFQIADGELVANSVTSTSLGSAAALDSESTVANDGNLPTGAAVTAYVASQISTALTSALIYKGVKATVAELPSSGQKVGDMWHVTETSGEYAWDGSAWQEMGSLIDLSAYALDADFTIVTNAQVDALFATAGE